MHIMTSITRHYWGQPVLRHLRKLQDMAKPGEVPANVLKQIQACMDVVNAREDYCERVSTPTSNAIRNLVTETKKHPWQQVFEEGKIEWRVSQDMLTGALEGSFLKTLVSMSNAKRVLDVGLFTGCSALAMAEALPADGTVTTCEISDYIGNFAQKLLEKSHHGKKIKIVIGPASASLRQMAKEGQQFDIVFIDADKEGYMDYYKIIMDNDMLSPSGTILVDNAFFGGQAYISPENIVMPGRKHTTVMQEFNDFVCNDDRVCQVVVPIRDGVTMIRRKAAFEGSA